MEALQEPDAMSRGTAIVYATGLPLALLVLIFLPAGRIEWSAVPSWLVGLGYGAMLAAIAVTAWAQAVNPFFEPGVRIQSERHQHVIDSGPYRIVRHPGYIAALFLFLGTALSLGSF